MFELVAAEELLRPIQNPQDWELPHEAVRCVERYFVPLPEATSRRRV